jgi:hypothetical protein
MPDSAVPTTPGTTLLNGVITAYLRQIEVRNVPE